MAQQGDKKRKIVIAGREMEVSEMNPEVFGKPEERKLEAKTRQDLVARYELFRTVTNAKCRVIYHPCSGMDVSPSKAFPDSKVLYVETDERVVEALKNAGLDAHYASALEFDPGDVDVLIMINPEIAPDKPAQYVILGGYVLCNNYHGTAARLREFGGFNFVAVIRSDKERGLTYDTEGLDDCWREVETEEEWKNAPQSWGAEGYEQASRVVEAITGKRENILGEYLKILERAKSQSPRGGPPLYYHGGQQFVLPPSLPKKKGIVDDLFVFQKI